MLVASAEQRLLELQATLEPLLAAQPAVLDPLERAQVQLTLAHAATVLVTTLLRSRGASAEGRAVRKDMVCCYSLLAANTVLHNSPCCAPGTREPLHAPRIAGAEASAERQNFRAGRGRFEPLCYQRARSSARSADVMDESRLGTSSSVYRLRSPP